MKHPALEPTYEAARSWALQPVGRPPPGWDHIVRSGLAIWMQERQPAERLAIQEGTLLKKSDGSGLLTIVAAMIAEVCQ